MLPNSREGAATGPRPTQNPGVDRRGEADSPPHHAARAAALLGLARALASDRQGGVLTEALDRILDAVGAPGGAAFRVAGADLEMVAQRGIPVAVRGELERLPFRGEPVSLVQRAAQTRAAAVGVPLGEGKQGRLDRALAAGTAWWGAVALPAVDGRETVGVVLVAAPSRAPGRRHGAEAFDDEVLAFLETASHVVALAMARSESGGARGEQSDVKTAHLAALGTLAATLADELSAPLAAAATQVAEQEAAARRARRSDTDAPDLDRVLELSVGVGLAIGRAREVTGRLLASRRATPERIDLGRLVARAVTRVSAQLENAGVELESSIGPGCFVLGWSEELCQLFVNLLLNAADACESIRGSRSEARRSVPRVELVVEASPSRVVASVADSGAGVAAHLRGRIFEPFFTTKKERLGLGLALARQTVVAHRGHVELTASDDLGGALFRVVLPAAPARERSLPAPPALTGRGSEARRAHRATDEPTLQAPPAGNLGPPVDRAARVPLLWVDDDELFLMTMERALESCAVRTARTAAEAELILADPALPPAIVLCDVGLPDRPGTALHAAIAERSPELADRFVFVTGGVVSPELASYLVRSGCQTLFKPVDLDKLTELIEGRGAWAALAQAPTLTHDGSGPAPDPRTRPTQPRMPAAQPRRR